jgi:hypothetical protein
VQVPLLGKMTDAEMEMLVPEVELVTFEPHQAIVTEAASDFDMYVCVSGACVVTKQVRLRGRGSHLCTTLHTFCRGQ